LAFARAETDMYFGVVVADGGFGTFAHHREPMAIEHQTVVRANPDTLYLSAMFDLDAGSVTITLPDAAERFMSMQLIDEDHYIPAVVYGGGSYAVTSEQSGTRSSFRGVRTNNCHGIQQGNRFASFTQVPSPAWIPLSVGKSRPSR
jgi:hypothetical protein